jgi:hypothetical protein
MLRFVLAAAEPVEYRVFRPRSRYTFAQCHVICGDGLMGCR